MEVDDRETAKLVLRTIDILSNVPMQVGIDNTRGSILGNGGYLVWKDVNI